MTNTSATFSPTNDEEAHFYALAIADGIKPELAARVAIFSAAIARIVRSKNRA